MQHPLLWRWVRGEFDVTTDELASEGVEMTPDHQEILGYSMEIMLYCLG